MEFILNTEYANIISDLKLLPRHGVNNSTEELEKFIKGLTKEQQDAYNAIKDEFNSLFKGKSIVDLKSLEATIMALERVASITEVAVQMFDILEQRAIGVADGFNLSNKRGIDFRKSLDGISSGVDANADAAAQYIVELKSLIPGLGEVTEQNKNYYKTAVLSNDILRDRLKLDDKEALSLRKLTRLQRGELIPNIEEYLKVADEFSDKGIMGSFQIFAEGISESSSKTLAQYSSQMPAALMKTTVEAKRLGLSLDDLYNAGEGFLDIQKQTQAQYRFQLFTGKKLETQTYKNVAAAYNRATMEQDAAEQLKIIKELAEEHGETIMTNFEGRKSMAAQLNMDENKLVDIITRMREIEKLESSPGVDEEGNAIEIKKLSAEAEQILNEQQVLRSKDVIERAKSDKIAETASKSKATSDDFTIEAIKKIVAGADGKGGIFGSFQKMLTDTPIGELVVDVMVIKGLIKGIQNTTNTAIKPTAEDFISRGDGTFERFRADDLVIGGTNLLGGNNNSGGMTAQDIASALSGLQFNVINKFDGNAILTSIEYAKGNTLT